MEAGLNIETLRNARLGTGIGHTVHYLEQTGSTNDVARELALQGAAQGTVVIADTQTRGRGRLQRTWVSPPGRNLYLSIVLRPPLAPETAPQIALVAGLAAVEAVRAHAPGAALKWPNDVVIGGRKVAGILAEMEVGPGGVDFVVLGIGVNLNGRAEDFPPELRQRAVHLQEVAGKRIDRTAFAEHLLSRFEERYDIFLTQGFAALRPVWESFSCLTGRRIRIDDQGQFHEGTVTGVAGDGALLLRTAAGNEQAVLAGEVTVVDGYIDAANEGGQGRKN